MNLRYHKSTVFLVAMAAVLSGVLLWDRGNVSTGEADKRTENIVEAWRPDDLSKIELTIGDKSMTMKRERDDEGQIDWVLYDGENKLDGDHFEMTSLVSTLELMMFYRRIEDVDRSKLGLDAPRATYVMHMGKLVYTVRVGGEAPSPKGGAYLEVEGGTRGRVTYVITEATLDELLIDPLELLNKQLAPLVSAAVKSYTIDNGKERYELERGGWGGWTTGAFMLKRKGQPDVRASRYQLDLLIGAIYHVEAKRFVPISRADPANAITIEMSPIDDGDKKAKLVVGDPPAGLPEEGKCREGEAYAVRREPSPLAGCVRASVLDDLRIGAAELRDRRVVGTEKNSMIEIKLESGGQVVDLARKGEGWHMRKPTEGPAEPEPTDQLIDALVKAEGSRVMQPDLAALGLERPRGTVRIIGLPERMAAKAPKEREEHIEVGDVVDGRIHVRRKDDGAVLALSAEVGALFLPRPTLLRSTQIFEEDKKYARGMSVDCGGRNQVLDRALSNQWSYVVPKDAEVQVDGALALGLLNNLISLTAVRWIAEKPSERHGLGSPWCTAAVKIEQPDDADPTGDRVVKRTLTVRMGAEAQGGYFAQIKEGGAVFVVPRAVANASDMWLMNRQALIPILKDVATITLVSRSDKKLVVQREGDSWKAVGGADALAVSVKNVLEQLTAEVVAHRGPPREDDGFDAPLLTITLEERDKPDAALKLIVGKASDYRNAPVFFIRRSDLNVTFLVAKSRIQSLLDTL